jgi:hypothetical protein
LTTITVNNTQVGQLHDKEKIMPNFSNFSTLVHDQFKRMAERELFVVDIDPDSVWSNYLNAFPEGTNPIFRERTEHDCSCCKNFIRNIGNVVAVIDGALITVFDFVGAEHPYDVVARHLSKLISQQPIKDVFRTKEPAYGAPVTRELTADGVVREWNHFHGKIGDRHKTGTPDAEKGAMKTAVQVLRRGLDELTLSALDTVIELIGQKSIYRGEEHLPSINEFRAFKLKFDELSDHDKNVFVWCAAGSRIARFRNTVIGQLIQDLSEGMDLERAVKKFEAMVAPQNYKRPTALITKSMVDSAMKTIRDLDLEPALERRFAWIEDVSVDDVLFVDNSVKSLMIGGVHDLLMSEVRAPVAINADGSTVDIGIDRFISDVLPRARSVSVLVKNQMVSNLVSLTAPVHTGVQPLFKWSNNFAWSYAGNVTDSIKERVKRAGGKIDAHLRVSLAWFNTDDLDLHVVEPDGNRVYFGNKDRKLDVDMNVNSPVRDAVENVVWSARNLKDGEHHVIVHNYTKRESIDVGFALEVEFAGRVQSFRYDRAVAADSKVAAVVLTVQNGSLVRVDTGGHMIAGDASQDVWNVKTETFVPVTAVMHSPNHWNGESTGNKHTFFILKDCLNPEKVRGIYNEFLRSDLEKHRRVFEILGEKTKCREDVNQLSGIGFSSTRNDSAVFAVQGDAIGGKFNVTF